MPLLHRLEWDDLDPRYLRNLIAMARREDLAGAGLKTLPRHALDVTTDALVPQKNGTARLIAREPLCLCGVRLIPKILETYGATGAVEASIHCTDGQFLDRNAAVATLTGDVKRLLTLERVLLNFIQHLSGIATETAAYVEALGETKTKLLDTRKTTPGFRMLEKYAVACGGGWNHRLGLFDRVLVKDNHLAAAEATSEERLAGAIRNALKKYPDLPVEVEVDHIEQISPVLEAGAHIILLDNFSLSQLKEAVALIGDKAATEASGGIRRETLVELGRIGLDFISCGAIIHQSTWKDIALDWQ